MIADLKPYPTYKDSGVPLVGSVPKHWDVLQLGRFGRFSKGNGGTKEDETSDGVPCIRYGDLYTKYQFFIRQSRSFISAKRALYYTPIQYGDVLFAASGETIEEIGKSAVNLIESDACCGGDVILFRPSIELNAQFMGYAADSQQAAFQKSRIGRGITVMHVYGDQLKYMWVALPPLPEQAAIVRFLDHADLRIRNYIRVKQKLVKLLDEQKKAIIHQAVTRGLDANVRFKPSGVEWLGDVPERWELVPLKFASSRVQNGATPPTAELAYYDEGTVPWYGPSSCGQHELVGRPVRYLTEAAFLSGRARRIRGPALLIVVIGATAGRMALLPDEDGSTNQQITSYELRSDRVIPRFVVRQLRGAETWLRSTASTATIPILDAGQVSLLTIAVPPLSEQRAIVRQLELNTEGANAAMHRAEHEIALLREYRIRLITDVVTGKLDVREAAANLPTQADEVADDEFPMADEPADGSVDDRGELSSVELTEEEVIA